MTEGRIDELTPEGVQRYQSAKERADKQRKEYKEREDQKKQARHEEVTSLLRELCENISSLRRDLLLMGAALGVSKHLR